MAEDLQGTLTVVAQSLGLKAKNRVQSLFDDHKKFLSGREIKTPVETVSLLDENFPYWIKLESPHPSFPGEWVGAVANIAIPQLDAGVFDLNGYRYNESRAKSLLDVPNLLRNPHCVHVNLRHGHRGTGSIEGRHLYVLYAKDNQRKVAFVTYNRHRTVNVLVTSFWTTPGWIADCADSPALWTRSGHLCTCCKHKKATLDGVAPAPITPGPE